MSKDWIKFYKDLPDEIKEACKKIGIAPEKIGIELGKEERDKTIWDLNPMSRDKWLRFETSITCATCGKQVKGHLILDKKELKLVDSAGFVILDKPVCEECLGG